MKYRTGAALFVAAILSGSLLPATAMAEEPAEAEAAAVASEALQQELAARLQKDAEVVASDAMTAASDLDLPLEIERVIPGRLVLVSDL